MGRIGPAPKGNQYAVGSEGGEGRPPNWLREECRKASARIDTIAILEKAALNEKGTVRLEAIKMLWDRGWGKAEQTIDLNHHDDSRPTTDTLIQTITALRSELDSLRKGTGLETGK